MQWVFRRAGVLVFAAVLSQACAPNAPTAPANTPGTDAPQVVAPDFSGDSALAAVRAQLAFGPRVPGTVAHQRCGNWLVARLRAYGAQVTEQKAQVAHYTGRQLPIRNLVASFNPQAQRRVLVSAHWDTRPMADADTVRKNEPIPGANDGGSGVAVLLELARQLQAKPASVGVDLVFWDLEDWGDPDNRAEDSWALGSQHWSRTPHRAGYTALYGINLDMVGATDAVFYQEEHSRQFAPAVVDKVWQMAHRLGHGSRFSFQRGQAVLDDHYYVNTLAKIPMANIIHTQLGGNRLFFPHWHTHGDDIDKLSAASLQAVGQTVLAVIYSEP